MLSKYDWGIYSRFGRRYIDDGDPMLVSDHTYTPPPIPIICITFII